MVDDMYLMQVKDTGRIEGRVGPLQDLATVPSHRAYCPLDQGGCPLVARR
jgi:branched-chain amino acid transport system substrate-binding protein